MERSRFRNRAPLLTPATLGISCGVPAPCRQRGSAVSSTYPASEFLGRPLPSPLRKRRLLILLGSRLHFPRPLNRTHRAASRLSLQLASQTRTAMYWGLQTLLPL